MGRVITASCHITARVPTVADVKMDEIVLENRWPSWEARISEHIQKVMGPSTDPDRVHRLSPRDIVKIALLWVKSQEDQLKQ